jgi:hypothetical protein
MLIPDSNNLVESWSHNNLEIDHENSNFILIDIKGAVA